MISLSYISIIFQLDYISILQKTFLNPDKFIHSLCKCSYCLLCYPGSEPGVSTVKDTKSMLLAQELLVRKGDKQYQMGARDKVVGYFEP